jgi:hypothetical protein
MIFSFVLVGVSLLLLLLLLLAARGQSAAVSQLDDLVGRTRPVDLDAFRNLIDPDEEDFLRTNLPPSEFRAVQRERLRAAVEYVRNAAHNAAILLRLGEAATRSVDPSVAAAGQQLIDSALRLRLYALLSVGKLYVGIALPGAHPSAATLLDNYQRLSDLAGRLAVMQHPARAARLSAVL